MNAKIIENTLIISIDNTAYNLDILHKCFYWYGNKYIVDIQKLSNTNNEISIKPKYDEAIDFDSLINKVKQDLIDFKLRDIVNNETRTIREILIAKAFAYYDFADNPTSEISDPVGFNPETIGNE